MIRIMAASLVLALAAQALAQAQTPPVERTVSTAQDPVTQVDDIVVTGQRLEEQARTFVGQVAAPSRAAPLARWHERLCIGAVNMDRAASQFLIDRVSAVAQDVGLEPGLPDCEPQVIIVGTLDGNRVAGGLVERRRGMLAPLATGFSRSRSELQAFAEEDRPVRWWHVGTAVDPATGRSMLRQPKEDNFNSNRVEEILEDGPVMRSEGSLVVASTRQDLRRAVIIVDFNRLGDVDFEQLADYVAFVALAQVDPKARTADYSTILNVFDAPSTTPGLTNWDRAYLRGLYQSDNRIRSANGREAAVRREMVRALAGRDVEAE